MAKKILEDDDRIQPIVDALTTHALSRKLEYPGFDLCDRGVGSARFVKSRTSKWERDPVTHRPSKVAVDRYVVQSPMEIYRKEFETIEDVKRAIAVAFIEDAQEIVDILIQLGLLGEFVAESDVEVEE